MSFLLDNREGSYPLANLEPVRSLLPPCPRCEGQGRLNFPEVPPHHRNGQCLSCRGTGRQLSRITTSRGEGGPDVLICGSGPSGPLLIAVEVKDLRDLLQSADTGRLQAEGEGQLQAMLTDYDVSWLVWYGTVRHGDSGFLEEPSGRGDNGRAIWRPFTKNRDPNGQGLRSAYLDAMLLAIADMGVHVHSEPNLRGVARWLGALYARWSKPWAEHEFTRACNPPPRIPQAVAGVPAQELRRARRIEGRFTGMGPDRALAAAKHFGSVAAMAAADEKQWREVPGIGPVLSASLVKEFNS